MEGNLPGSAGPKEGNVKRGPKGRRSDAGRVQRRRPAETWAGAALQEGELKSCGEESAGRHGVGKEEGEKEETDREEEREGRAGPGTQERRPRSLTLGRQEEGLRSAVTSHGGLQALLPQG